MRRVTYTHVEGNFTMQAMEMIEELIHIKVYRFRIRGFEPEDVAQELRAHIFRKFDKYDPTKASVKTWANHVLQNKLRSMNRITPDHMDLASRYDDDIENEYGYDAYDLELGV